METDRGAQLEAAIANMTRLLARTDDEAVAVELVAERRSMRAELRTLRDPVPGIVVGLGHSPDKR